MIHLFYYKNNLGDILSYYIIKKISGEDIRFTNPLSIKIVIHDLLSFGKLLIKRQWKTAASRITFSFKPVIIGVGSLLEHSTSNCITWGTGMAQKHMIPSGGRFLITRGYLSKQVLENVGFKVESEICGDPALLMPLLYKPNIEIITDKIGVIPHISEIEEVRSQLIHCPHIDIIDFRTSEAEVENTLNLLLSYSVVYSSSLHGLILCHAYDIPCLWFQNNVLVGGDFKFLDHFSAIGIRPYKPLTIDDIKNGKRLSKEEETVPRSLIIKIQNELLKKAPFKIKYLNVVSEM